MAQNGAAKSNPFGNYSFMEAQGTKTTKTEPTTPMAMKESPFGNYSFREAQQSRNAAEPLSPISSRSNNFRTDDTAPVQNTSSIHSFMAGKPEKPIAFEGYSFSEAQGDSPASATRQYQPPGEQAIDTSRISDLADAGRSSQSVFPYDALDDMEHGSNMAGDGIEQFVIRALYDEFRDRSAAKIDMIVELRLDSDPDLARYLDKGVDPVFDRTLQKLGMLARRRARVIIELLLVWRKATIDCTDEFPLDGSLASAYSAGKQAISTPSLTSRAHSIARDRRSLASVYILCRALVAVVGQLESTHLEGDLGDRLEELVFRQVREVNPANLRRSQNRRDIQDLYVELIGKISEVRFASMSDRFIAELERIPMVSGANDERIVILLQNMRSLKLRVFPIDALEESSAFLLSCAKFYSRTSGSLRLKHAWATLLTELLMPMAAVVDVEVNMPELVQAIEIIYAKAMKMASKVRHINVAFPLVAATLCISRREVFQQRWLVLLGYCIQRLKDKQFRRVAVDAILRIFWVYLFRYPESNSMVVRRIDALTRIFFPATKLHAWPKTVPLDAYVYFLACAACYNFDYMMRSWLHTMLQLDSGWPGTTRDVSEPGPILDPLNPARVSLAFQALLSVAVIHSNKGAGGSGAAATATGAAPAGAGTAGTASNGNKAGGSGQVSSTGTGGLARPAFPGVSQLSGLDIFRQVASANGIRSDDSAPLSAGALSGPGAGKAAALPYRLGPAAHGELVDHPGICIDKLPENVRNAVVTTVGVITRYVNFLYPVFGHYVLADERLWRLTRTVPPFSSVVLTGSSLKMSNTAVFWTRDKSGLQQISSSGSQAGAIASGSTAGGEPRGPGGSGSGGGGTESTAVVAAGTGNISSGGGVGGGGAAGGSEDAGNGRYLDTGGSGSSGTGHLRASSHGQHGGNGSGGDDNGATVASIRLAIPRYPAERQGYVDLLTVYARYVRRANKLWGQVDTRKLVETLVQSMLHVDQALAGESRVCLLDILQSSTMFPDSESRLVAIGHAVTRTTQLLRAIDERFSEILVGGIYARDPRATVSFTRADDPLSDAKWPYDLAGGRRVAHIASLSTASSVDAQATGEQTTGSDDESYAEKDNNDDDDDDQQMDAVARALDAKVQLGKVGETRDLNGGFLHVFLDLLGLLEAALRDRVAEPSDGQTTAVGGRDLAEWGRLVNAVEANGIALLCSSNARVRHAAVSVLCRVGLLRRLFAAGEPEPVGGQWVFKTAESAYDVLNEPVVRGSESAMLDDEWEVPFGSDDTDREELEEPGEPLGRLAGSSATRDESVWQRRFPGFVQLAGTRLAEVMLVARTLVCQRLYQMQALMNQYAELRSHDKLAPRGDLIRAFHSLFLFAVVSLPPGDGASAHMGSETVIRAPQPGSGSNRNRLAKSLARKLAPLKTGARGHKQEQGVGLASVAQLVRIASAILRTDNHMLRQHTVHALCHTPAAHLQELMRELRPLADALFDDGSAAVHRNYLHVAAGSAGLAIKTSSPAAQPPMLPTSSDDDLASDVSSLPSSRRAGSFDAAAKDDPTAAGSTSVQRRKRLRHSLAQLYKHVARQLAARDTSGRALFQDDLVISQLIAYVRETRTFLTDANAMSEPEHQGLRMQFCGLVEALYYFLSEPATQPLLPKAARRFTHETRRGLYQLCERWCGLDPSKDDRLRRAALRSLAVLCREAPANTSEGGPRDQPALLAWVAEALADRSLQSIAQHAISWTVLADPADVEMLRALIQLAYGDGRVALGCLAALTNVLASDTLLPECQPWLLVLLLVHVQADQRMLRHQALLLLQTLRQDPHMTAALAPAILADVPAVARRAACQLAENVAGAFPEMSAQICAEVARQVSELPEPRLACLLRILRPWLANVQLAASEPPPSMAPGTAISEDSQHVLQCLLLITTRAGAAHIDAMQDAWAAVVESPTHGLCNQRVVVQFLVTLLLRLRNSALLVLVRRVCVFLARSAHRTQLLDQLISETCRASAFVPLPHIPEDHSVWAEEFRAAMGHGETVQIATGALALYCLNAIALEQPLPLLRVLPPALFAIAYPEPWVRVSARALIRTLVAQQPGDSKPLLAILRSPACLSGFGHLDKKDSTDLLDTLPSDLLPRGAEPPNDQSRITLQTLVAGLSQSISSPEFAQSLATDAVNWAMGCPVRHMAALSLQIFSSLAIEAQHGSVVVTPTRNMVLRLIDRLSNVLENEPELSVFAETVLHALRQVAVLVVRNADVEIVSDLMATAISVMQVAGSGVYAAALGVFERVFPLITDHDNIRTKIRAKTGLKVSGYQPALLHGLKFSACRERCLRLLREEPCMDIAILSVAAHLPSMLEPSWDETPADRHAPVTSLFDKYHSFVQRALTGTTADESRKFLSLLLSHLSSPTNSNNLVRQFGYCASDHSPSDFLSVLLDLCSPSMRARTALKHLSALQFASLQSTPLLGEIRRIAISLDLFASVLSCSQVATLAVDLRLLVQLNVMAGIIAKRAERALLLVLQRARERTSDVDGLDVARQALARIVAMGVDDENLGCDNIVETESGDEDLLRDLDDFDRMLDEALLQ